ncbi:MAG: glycosyltransferase [Bacteroidetes bacterium]|nr:glycosyltransferase [Bacteroidota bacterium]
MRILIAPLDWGLGHATRCIPIIKYLLEKKHEVVIGADGRPLQLLKKEFPSLEFVVMPCYNISYSRNVFMVFKMAVQIPKILLGINREHALLKKIIKEKRIDAVISDNRFGLWSREVPCVFITHQLMVKSPFGEKIIHRLNVNYISKYSECWIPDQPPLSLLDKEGSLTAGLTGDLSHKFSLPKNAKFIGVLSRFESPQPPLQGGDKRHLLIILSGPEPQRTMFEKEILEQIKKNPILSLFLRGSLIVQGITERNERKKISKNVEIVSHLTSDALQKEILSSEIILSRPGYSTVMDMAVLGKKAIFVPTPGQTEQEYLADYFSEKKIAYSVLQKKFDLNIALKESEKYSGFTQKYSEKEFEKVVDDFLKLLNHPLTPP